MTLREKVYAKYNGKCAYTGKPLESDWQIDHVIPQIKFGKYLKYKSGLNSFENLMPCLKLVNHYKRSLDLEGFRRYIATLQIRIDKLPKYTKYRKEMLSKPNYEGKLRTWNRAEYLKRVAELFGITPETPFSGKFYFEDKQ